VFQIRGRHRLGDDGRVLFLHREEKVCSSVARKRMARLTRIRRLNRL